MRQCGADTGPIEALVGRVAGGTPVPEALAAAPGPGSRFAATTWEVLSRRQPHRTAAVFTLAREEIIPEMFYGLVWNIQERFPGRLSRLVYYLERHINVDKDRHAPMALRMLQELCGRDPKRWSEAAESARACLRARLRLWDDVAALLPRAA
jgi:pyrroloquinoline quinone (PQQ) biosynthesis protein C